MSTPVGGELARRQVAAAMMLCSAAAACSTSHAPADAARDAVIEASMDAARDDGLDGGVTDLGHLDLDLGSTDGDLPDADLHCWAASGPLVTDSWCRTSAECNDWQTCQSGLCCGGTLDPATCECMCPGIGTDAGTACEVTGQSCCVSDPSWHGVPAEGMLVCRPAGQCAPRGI